MTKLEKKTMTLEEAISSDLTFVFANSSDKENHDQTSLVEKYLLEDILKFLKNQVEIVE